jgi:hypothetical protein
MKILFPYLFTSRHCTKMRRDNEQHTSDWEKSLLPRCAEQRNSHAAVLLLEYTSSVQRVQHTIPAIATFHYLYLFIVVYLTTLSTVLTT